ncbi:MAG: hypothetical protein OXI51_08845 [Chloroflexota bacterium]|nr:hypothetical protein [Chloroflexota bacterium]
MTTEKAKVEAEDLLDRDPQDLVEMGPDGVERLFGMTLEEHMALKRPATPELIEWAEKKAAEYDARHSDGA